MKERGRRVFSSRLVDLEGPECNYPKCRAPGRQRATGWLEFSRDFNHWMYECSCSDPDHGFAFVSSGPLRTDVIAALDELGLNESSELPLDGGTRIEPTCADCGDVTATIVLSDSAKGSQLDVTSYGGTVSTSQISPERAALIAAAAELPYDAERMWNAGIDEDLGFCRQCGTFYCGAHWREKAWCPRGHLMSIEF